MTSDTAPPSLFSKTCTTYTRSPVQELRTIYSGEHRHHNHRNRCRGDLPPRILQAAENPLDALVKIRLGQRQRLDRRQPTDVLGKVLGGGHPGAVDEHRQDLDLSLQRRGNLLAQLVVGLGQPGAPFGVEPANADDGDEKPGHVHALGDDRLPLGAFFDRVFVEEHPVGPKRGAQAFGEARGVTRRVVAAIADEDVSHCAAVPDCSGTSAGIRRARSYRSSDCHRERANSVLLLGEAGVGKAAIAAGLAHHRVGVKRGPVRLWRDSSVRFGSVRFSRPFGQLNRSTATNGLEHVGKSVSEGTTTRAPEQKQLYPSAASSAIRLHLTSEWNAGIVHWDV